MHQVSSSNSTCSSAATLLVSSSTGLCQFEGFSVWGIMACRQKVRWEGNGGTRPIALHCTPANSHRACGACQLLWGISAAKRMVGT